MGFLIRVMKGNTNEAFRQLTRRIQADGQAKLTQRHRVNVKPCQARRQARGESERRRERQQLLQNLRVVFARKARGF